MRRLCYSIRFLILTYWFQFSLACHFKRNRFNRIPSCWLFTVTCKHIFHSTVQNFWYSDWKIFFWWGVDFFGVLAFESDLPLKDLRTFSRNLKQNVDCIDTCKHHVPFFLIISWHIGMGEKCYHCQLDSNFMPTAQVLQISKKCCLLIPEDTFTTIT